MLTNQSRLGWVAVPYKKAMQEEIAKLREWKAHVEAKLKKLGGDASVHMLHSKKKGGAGVGHGHDHEGHGEALQARPPRLKSTPGFQQKFINPMKEKNLLFQF